MTPDDGVFGQARARVSDGALRPLDSAMPPPPGASGDGRQQERVEGVLGVGGVVSVGFGQVAEAAVADAVMGLGINLHSWWLSR